MIFLKSFPFTNPNTNFKLSNFKEFIWSRVQDLFALYNAKVFINARP